MYHHELEAAFSVKRAAEVLHCGYAISERLGHLRRLQKMFFDHWLTWILFQKALPSSSCGSFLRHLRGRKPLMRRGTGRYTSPFSLRVMQGVTEESSLLEELCKHRGASCSLSTWRSMVIGCGRQGIERVWTWGVASLLRCCS